MPATPGHAVVTGGSSGIGAAVVTRLLERGMTVTVLDLQPLGATVDSSGVHHVAVDVVDEPAVTVALQAGADRFGTPTSLVTCHGVRGQFVPALELDLDRTRHVLKVHVLGTLVVARAFARLLETSPPAPRAPAPAVVTISSTTAYGGWAAQSDYGPAKAAVVQLMRNLAIEWAPRGIRVNAVAPGHTRTPMVQDLVEQGYDLAPVHGRTPLGRLATPEEMAATIEHLLLEATFVTGQCLAVDGGWTAVGK